MAAAVVTAAAAGAAVAGAPNRVVVAEVGAAGATGVEVATGAPKRPPVEGAEPVGI